MQFSTLDWWIFCIKNIANQLRFNVVDKLPDIWYWNRQVLVKKVYLAFDADIFPSTANDEKRKVGDLRSVVALLHWPTTLTTPNLVTTDDNHCRNLNGTECVVWTFLRRPIRIGRLHQSHSRSVREYHWSGTVVFSSFSAVTSLNMDFFCCFSPKAVLLRWKCLKKDVNTFYFCWTGKKGRKGVTMYHALFWPSFHKAQCF